MRTNIRKIEDKDLDNVITLALRTPELRTQKGKPEYYSKGQLKGFIKNPNAIFLGAFIGNLLVGFRLATFDGYAKEAYLINLVINKEFEHKGIGQLLYTYTFNYLKKKDCYWTWVLVHEKNLRMQSFLKKQKFEQGQKFIYFRKRLKKSK
jgi:diamine N-acetyltransferase